MSYLTHKYITRFFFKKPFYSKSLVHSDRINFMTSLVERLIYEKVKGNIIEVGVYRGGTMTSIAKKLQELKSDKKFYAVDTFEGHPYSDVKGVHKKGRYSDTDFNRVLKVIVRNNFINMKLIKGNFIDVTHFFKNKKFCFVHLDVDLEQSYYECLDFLIPRIADNGIIFFDDYSSKSARLSNKAIHKFIPESKIIKLPVKQAYWINE